MANELNETNDYKLYLPLCNDAAEKLHRLNEWEQSFIASIHAQLWRMKDEAVLTEKQKEKLKQIEAKVYAT